MAIRQTYESHLVGVGLPMTGDKLTGVGSFTDSIRFLPFAQGLAYSYQKNIVRESMLAEEELKFNRQINWSDVTVNIRQLDYYITGANYNSIFEDLNIFPRGGSIAEDIEVPAMSGLVNGGRSADGAAIYFLTDTGSLYRDQIDNTDIYEKQYTIFDPCYLSSISWTQQVGSVAFYEFEFVGNYIAKSTTTGNSLSWLLRRPLKSGTQYTGTVSVTGAHASGSYLNIETASGLFQPQDAEVSGAPDFGPIRGASWQLSLARNNIYSLGNPMANDRKIMPHAVGSLTLQYNFEGQEIDAESFTDTMYNISIINTNLYGKQKIYNISGAILESVSLNSSTDGSPDSYSAQFSFPVSMNTGLYVVKS